MNAFLRHSSEKCQSGRMDLIRNQAHERLCRGFESLFLLYNCLKSPFGVIQMGFFRHNTEGTGGAILADCEMGRVIQSSCHFGSRSVHRLFFLACNAVVVDIKRKSRIDVVFGKPEGVQGVIMRAVFALPVVLDPLRHALAGLGRQFETTEPVDPVDHP